MMVKCPSIWACVSKAGQHQLPDQGNPEEALAALRGQLTSGKTQGAVQSKNWSPLGSIGLEAGL